VRLFLALIAAFAVVLTLADRSVAQTYPRACYFQGQVIPCPNAPTPVPSPGATPPPVAPPPGGGPWYEHYVVGDAQFNQYEIYLNPDPAGGSAIPIAGYIHDTRTGASITIYVLGGDGVTLTIPAQTVGTTTFVEIEVNATNGQAKVLTSTVSFASIIRDSQSWKFVWRVTLYAGAAPTRAVGQAVKP